MAAINLGTASSFGVLAGTTVTNTGFTIVTGDVGVSPGSAITGFPPGSIVGGTEHAADAVALQAQNDLKNAYNDAASRAFNSDLTGQDLGGMTLTPGVYFFSSSAQLTGNLTLNGFGQYIFQIASTLTTASTSSVTLINGARACNVFWQVGSSATLGIGTTFKGTIMALTSISLTTGASMLGSALARTGAVTLDTNTVQSTAAVCSGGDPHSLCIDGTRIDLYEPGCYRLFDNCDEGDRIVINAEIQRNPETHEDHYKFIWIKCKTGNEEYLIEFTNDKIVVKTLENKKIRTMRMQYIEKAYSISSLRKTNKLALISKIKDRFCFSKEMDHWTFRYMTNKGLHYTLSCERKYSSICMNVPCTSGSMVYAGLFSGQIMSVSYLKDESILQGRVIQPSFYTSHALLCGSMDPHVISIQGKKIVLTGAWYRLLQWKNDHTTGVINVFLDGERRLRKLVFKTKIDGQWRIDVWEWTGPNHWELQCSHNGVALKKHDICEKQFDIVGGLIFVRVQANGSISAAFKDVDSHVRGLFFNDIISILGSEDHEIYNLPVLELPLCCKGSFYECLLEPHLVSVV